MINFQVPDGVLVERVTVRRRTLYFPPTAHPPDLPLRPFTRGALPEKLF